MKIYSRIAILGAYSSVTYIIPETSTGLVREYALNIVFIQIFCLQISRTPTMSVQKQKDACYLEKYSDGRRLFQCLLCWRTVNSKRSVLNHLFQQHGLCECHFVFTELHVQCTSHQMSITTFLLYGLSDLTLLMLFPYWSKNTSNILSRLIKLVCTYVNR